MSSAQFSYPPSDQTSFPTSCNSKIPSDPRDPKAPILLDLVLLIVILLIAAWKISVKLVQQYNDKVRTRRKQDWEEDDSSHEDEEQGLKISFEDEEENVF